MTTEPSLHAHIIGFPHYTNSKNTDDGDEEQKDVKTVARCSVYEPLYELASKYLEDGYSLLYVAESLPNGERDKAEVIENIRNVNTDQAENIQNNISKGMLDVIDSDNIYKDNYDGRDIVDSLLSNISEMQRKLQEKTKGTMIFNSPDPYFSRGKYDVFRVFEREITKTLPNDASLLCWYKRKWLNKLSLAHAISLLTDHIYTIHSNWKYRKWDTNKIIDKVKV
jgi:MEDS: MEthanogen/methylotroph, DcmR Sensory domain